MTGRWSLGIGARLTIALAGVAVLSVALATLLANAGLDSRLRDAAESRLAESARHSADLAARIYARDGGWDQGGVDELRHLAEMNGYLLSMRDRSGRLQGAALEGRERASAPVRVNGRPVGSVEVSPVSGGAVTAEDRQLHGNLNRLHLLAALLALALALAAATLVAPRLARPLRRLRDGAVRMEHGDLATRVDLSGGREIEQVGQSLNRLAETLEREETLRREAAADVAHELRTPLGGIVSRVEAAQDGVLSEQQALAAIEGEAHRLNGLVEDLGRLADAQRPGLLIEKQQVDLAEVARRQADRYRELFAGKGIAFERQLEPAPVRGDAGRLDQIVDNLLANALRYTDEGGKVSLRVHAVGRDVELDVGDTGIGISADDLPHVFERFWRGERSRSRATGGAGIGLAIVRELVRAHDGDISVDSEPGSGSRFHVKLPAARPV